RHAQPDGAIGTADLTVPADPYLTADHPIGAKNRTSDFCPPCAHQPAQTDDLACTDDEINAIHAISSRHALDLEHDLTGRLAVMARVRGVHFAPDHQRHELVGCSAGGQQASDLASVAQHRDAIADLEHLGQAMRYVDHRYALRLQTPNHREQALGLALGQS